MTDHEKHPGDARAANRAQRLAEELRANLGKRRAQARARKKPASGAAGAAEPASHDGLSPLRGGANND
jgi:hypothetical protein